VVAAIAGFVEQQSGHGLVRRFAHLRVIALHVGTTDEIGLRALDRPVHVHDIHATIRRLLGLNHLNLTFLPNGRAERPTPVAGNLIPGEHT